MKFLGRKKIYVFIKHKNNIYGIPVRTIMCIGFYYYYLCFKRRANKVSIVKKLNCGQEMLAKTF